MTSEGTKEATERIQEELKRIKSLDEAKIGFSASPSGQDLYHWNIRLRDFDYDTDLGQARIVSPSLRTALLIIPNGCTSHCRT